MTYVIGLSNNLGIWYPLFHVLSGGLMFGAIFMATDPVTSPVTSSGQVLYALGLGLLTVIFRFLSIYPEGVMIAILTMNFLVIIIDKMCAHYRFNLKKMILLFSIVILMIGSITYYIFNKNNTDNNGQNNYPDLVVKEIVIVDNNNIYHVTYKGYHGLIESNITVNIETEKIINIEVISQNENVWDSIESNDYLNKIINNQDNLNNLDAISGATYTSNYLKEMIHGLKEYIEAKNE
jgi:electron transport complex protein RnfD